MYTKICKLLKFLVGLFYYGLNRLQPLHLHIIENCQLRNSPTLYQLFVRPVNMIDKLLAIITLITIRYSGPCITDWSAD